MSNILLQDKHDIQQILQTTCQQALTFLTNLDHKAVAIKPEKKDLLALPQSGLGAILTLEKFKQRHEAHLSASAGPRYFGFVTGGATPASIAGDWLTSAYDQNATGFGDSSAPLIELETIQLLKQLLNLADDYVGVFVTGATMANFAGLALARQWTTQQLGVDAAQSGLYGLPTIKVLSATPHSSSIKSLSMLGMGRDCVQLIPCLPGREAIDIAALEQSLLKLQNQPVIVIGSAGTVNTVDFDDLEALGKLKQRFNFWLHIDGAFGAFAACSPKFSHLTKGLNFADSITVDAHKWLNVPYDSGIHFSRHINLQQAVFQNYAPYLGKPNLEEINFVHLTPENSRRFRALPTWMTLMAYGREGYQSIIEGDCALAKSLESKLEQSSAFEILSEVYLNTVCFTLSEQFGSLTKELIKEFLTQLTAAGKVFLTSTTYQEKPAIRAALSNWRTEKEDIDIVFESLEKVAKQFKEIMQS